MSYFISLLAILIATLSLCHLTGKGVEVIFPITNLTVIAVLYVFGYFGAFRNSGFVGRITGKGLGYRG